MYYVNPLWHMLRLILTMIPIYLFLLFPLVLGLDYYINTKIEHIVFDTKRLYVIVIAVINFLVFRALVVWAYEYDGLLWNMPTSTPGIWASALTVAYLITSYIMHMKYENEKV